MDLREIDQIKTAEGEAGSLIDAARHRMRLAIEEAKREGEERVHIRSSDAEDRLRSERESQVTLLKEEITTIMTEAEGRASELRKTGTKNMEPAVIRLVGMITGVDDVLPGTNE